MGKSKLFLYPDGDPDQSKYLIESKLDQDPPSDIFQVDSSSSICVIPLTTRQTDKRTNR